jgi:putative oxidoreductase
MKKALNIIRIIFGVLIAIFGANKFFNFMPAPSDLPDSIMNYMSALMATKTLYLVGAVEFIAGLSFIFNKYGALMAIILMSVSVNIILFHITLNPDGIGPGVVMFLLNILMLFNYRDKYRDLLKG